MDLFNFIGENLGWFACLVVVLAWAIKEKMTDTVDAIVEKTSSEIERPQLTIRVDVYAGNVAKIVATDAEGRLMPDILQQEGQEKALKLVGYAKLPSPPVEAVREATTTLQGVEVEVPQSPVDEGLDVVYPKEATSKQTKLEDIKAGILPKGVADAETP
jgi:hypothetical protein